MRKTKRVLQAATMVIALGSVKAQSVSKPTFSVWDGMVVSGYVGNGAYVNFGGPSVKISSKPYSIILGMLPSVRIKKDNEPANAKRNAAFTPSLGFGATGAYKHFLFQVPLYYDAKTASANGKWNVGVGIGYKL